jgi:hypothetical protein
LIQLSVFAEQSFNKRKTKGIEMNNDIYVEKYNQKMDELLGLLKEH